MGQVSLDASAAVGGVFRIRAASTQRRVLLQGHVRQGRLGCGIREIMEAQNRWIKTFALVLDARLAEMTECRTQVENGCG